MTIYNRVEIVKSVTFQLLKSNSDARQKLADALDKYGANGWMVDHLQEVEGDLLVFMHMEG